jgi:hypothetical protein
MLIRLLFASVSFECDAASLPMPPLLLQLSLSPPLLLGLLLLLLLRHCRDSLIFSMPFEFSPAPLRHIVFIFVSMPPPHAFRSVFASFRAAGCRHIADISFSFAFAIIAISLFHFLSR